MAAISTVLGELGLSGLMPHFVAAKVDTTDTAKLLTDDELSTMGLTTIGDRARFREKVRKGSERIVHTSAHATASALFRPRRSNNPRVSQREKQSKTKRTWTTTWVCLAKRAQEHTPLADESDELRRAGLGSKRITLYADDNEDDVYHRILNEFVQLSDCGGFELLKWLGKDRKLKVIEGNWSVKNLKTTVGFQSKIYIRPVQKDLNVTQLAVVENCEIKQTCMNCGQDILVGELRLHVQICKAPDSNDSDQEETTNHESVINSQSSDPQPAINRQSLGPQPAFNRQSSDHRIFINQQSSDPQTSVNQQSSDLQPSFSQESSDHQLLIIQELPDLQTIVNQQSSDLPPVVEYQSNSQIIATHQSSQQAVSQQLSGPQTAVSQQSFNFEIQEQTSQDEQSSLSDIKATTLNCINFCQANNITDPVDILRYIQKQIVQGRQLEVVSESEVLTGETNYIIVDRNDVLRTGFQEISQLENLRLTLEVEFYEEGAVDVGGPRKEFFSCILREIQGKYFDPVREWSDDYEIIGKILALSTLQNGLLPRVMNSEQVEELFSSNPRPFMIDLRRGLDSLGLFQIGVELPAFRQLFTPNTSSLTLRMMKHVLKPVFSPEGSNRRPLESLMYSKFVLYLRETASGRRGGVTLGKILKFVTGSPEEPVLGYALSPEIHFVVGNDSFLPTANTCINRLVLNIPESEREMPANGFLFNLFDFAFANDFYGLQ